MLFSVTYREKVDYYWWLFSVKNSIVIPVRERRRTVVELQTIDEWVHGSCSFDICGFLAFEVVDMGTPMLEHGIRISCYYRSIQMQSYPGEASSQVKKEEDEFTDSSFLNHLDRALQKPRDVAPLEDDDEDECQIIEDEDDNRSSENVPNQLVVYDPVANDTGQIEAIPDPTEYQPPPSRVLPSVGAFTVQCANCFKWRLIPTKEKYEEIRESILQHPFVCEAAREWRPEISCDDEADISQDGSRLWAIDKPNIAQPPPGWQRLLRIRGEGSTKFADVYYAAPSGKRLRSMVEIQKYLFDNPEYIREGVTMSQFSFQIPKPLQENYVRKRPSRVTSSYDGAGLQMSRPLEPTEDAKNEKVTDNGCIATVNPLSWAGPDDYPDFQIGGQGLSTPYFEAPVFDPVRPPTKKRTKNSGPGLSTTYFEAPVFDPVRPPTKKRTKNSGPGLSTPYFEAPVFDPVHPTAKKRTKKLPSKQKYNDTPVYNQHNIKVEEPQQSRNGAYDL
ncbi:hypothetical protein HHK36_026174 [Tetracentron sinense]|uniref:Uncharacterized protein n=1 Tax=Tetracentron sinense TaxID=13715 RepID=A0A835D736_TETSI|nr:hypothetical protein HHK36_026174 [Tetracentron sinense]